MKFLLLSLILTIFSLQKAHSIQINCDFSEDTLNGYVCISNSVIPTTKDDREVTSIVGNHQPGRSNDDVLHFYTNRRTEYFPRGLTKFFKNIQAVSVEWAGLKEISPEDVHQFGDKLKVFWIDGCDIEEIPAGTFSLAKNLESLHLHQNKIKSMESATFSGLTKLNSLRIDQNPCTGNFDYAVNDEAQIRGIIESIDGKCKNHVETTTRKSLFDTIQFSQDDVEKFLAQLNDLMAKASTEEPKE